MSLSYLAQYFPKYVRDPNDPVSPDTPDYNCIAFAAGDTNNWWDDVRYWPPGVPQVWSLASLHQAFATIGYVSCGANESLEVDFEKVAFYADASGRPTHAAWQRSDGRWKSKLGPQHDVIHGTPNCLESNEYGKPVAYMKRARQTNT